MFSTSVRWLERGCLSDSMRRQLRPWWWHRRRNNKKSLLQPPIVAMYNDSSSDISIFQIFHDISYEVPMYVKMSDNCNYSEPSLLPTDDRWQINPLSATCAGLFACIFWSGPRSLGRSQHVSAFFDRSPDDWVTTTLELRCCWSEWWRTQVDHQEKSWRSSTWRSRMGIWFAKQKSHHDFYSRLSHVIWYAEKPDPILPPEISSDFQDIIYIYIHPLVN